MKAFVTILGLLLVSSSLVSAQIKEGDNFEVGGGYNFNSTRTSGGNRYRVSGPGAYFEYRYEDDSHIYIGGQLDYKYANGEGDYYTQESVTYRTDYHQFCLEGLVGYTFLSDRVASPVVGLGLGGGCTYLNRTDRSHDLYFYGAITPRAGVQLWRFRLTAEFDFLFSRLNLGWSDNGVSFGVSSWCRVVTSIVSLNLGFSF